VRFGVSAVRTRVKEVRNMCERSKCLKPEKLKGKPEQCSPEQVRECHGDSKEHPCTQSKAEKK
jgi:hypothetical protein